LAAPQFDSVFTIQTDVSDFGMGVVLSQNGHLVAYFSKQFCPKMQHSYTYIREVTAITTVVQKWRQYFLGRRFIIQTDQKAIRDLLNQAILTLEQQHHLIKLLGFDFDIEYRLGKCNATTDALSRTTLTSDIVSVQVDSPAILALAIPQLDFLNDL
jgi:hypothetical protein